MLVIWNEVHTKFRQIAHSTQSIHLWLTCNVNVLPSVVKLIRLSFSVNWLLKLKMTGSAGRSRLFFDQITLYSSGLSTVQLNSADSPMSFTCSGLTFVILSRHDATNSKEIKSIFWTKLFDFHTINNNIIYKLKLIWYWYDINIYILKMAFIQNSAQRRAYQCCAYINMCLVRKKEIQTGQSWSDGRVRECQRSTKSITHHIRYKQV